MNPKIAAFVPIKLESGRLLNKNILMLGNRPLCDYIFNALLKVSEIDDVYVYCSDESIKKYIPDDVLFLKRDKKLDGNHVKGLEIYLSFLEVIKSDIYILAHATSPFMSPNTIRNALSKVSSGKYDSAFSVQRFQTFAWYGGKPINYSLNDIPRTQNLEPVLIETSGFFIFTRSILIENSRRIGFRPYIQVVNAMEGIDIDTKEDFEIAQSLLSQFLKN